jgi:hypothetical protein
LDKFIFKYICSVPAKYLAMESTLAKSKITTGIIECGVGFDGSKEWVVRYSVSRFSSR